MGLDLTEYKFTYSCAGNCKMELAEWEIKYLKEWVYCLFGKQYEV